MKPRRNIQAVKRACYINAVITALFMALGIMLLYWGICQITDSPKKLENVSSAQVLHDVSEQMHFHPLPYTVKAGDTISGLAKQAADMHGIEYSVALATIKSMNPDITNMDVIHVGDVINLPVSEKGGDGNGRYH